MDACVYVYAWACMHNAHLACRLDFICVTADPLEGDHRKLLHCTCSYVYVFVYHACMWVHACASTYWLRASYFLPPT